MSEATKELIAEAREWRKAQLPESPWGEGHIVNRLADALEAATRGSVQGEPKCECWPTEEKYHFVHFGATEPGSAIEFNPECPQHGETLEKIVSDYAAALYTMEETVERLSRATVPDAATEELANAKAGWDSALRIVNESNGIIKKLGVERDAALTEIESRIEDRDYWHGVATKAKDQLDAALAAVERVRTVHRKETRLNNWTVCTHCAVGMLQDPVDWPCDTIQALDGAPEPECEYVGQAYEASGFMRIQNDQLTPEKFDSWRKLMAQYPRVEILKRVKAVPAGPWLPVEGESKP